MQGGDAQDSHEDERVAEGEVVHVEEDPVKKGGHQHHDLVHRRGIAVKSAEVLVFVLLFQELVDQGVDHHVAEVVDQEKHQEDVMIHGRPNHGLLACREEDEQCQGSPCGKANPAQQPALVLRPLDELVDEDQEDEHHHAQLEQHPKLVIGAVQALDEDEFVEGQHAQDHPFDDGIDEVQVEGPSLIGGV